VLWTVAFTIMTRGQASSGTEDGTLTWSDVEREIERADRRDRHTRWPFPPPRNPPGSGE